MKRSDVVLAYVPNVGSPGGTVRPALVVQADYLNSKIDETILAAITTNVARVHEAHQLLIDIGTLDGAASGLLHNFAVRCERLHTIPQSAIKRVIGSLSTLMMQQVDECLRAALGIA